MSPIAIPPSQAKGNHPQAFADSRRVLVAAALNEKDPAVNGANWRIRAHNAAMSHGMCEKASEQTKSNWPLQSASNYRVRSDEFYIPLHLKLFARSIIDADTSTPAMKAALTPRKDNGHTAPEIQHGEPVRQPA
jgi:hypothetical protein